MHCWTTTPTHVGSSIHLSLDSITNIKIHPIFTQRTIPIKQNQKY